MKACATTVDTLKDILAQPSIGIVSVDDKFTLPVGQGIVIKATNFHSNQGVFILLNDGLSNGAELTLKDLLTDQYYSYGDVKTMLAAWQASKIIVEELVGSALPDEYKFHVVDGKVQAIDIIIDRGSDCPCYAVMDVDFNRLDSNGCFEPSGSDQQIFDVDKPVCTAIDFGTGARRAGPVKKDMYLCSDVKKPKQCVLDDMTTIAESLSKTIGVYMRIDMFLVGDQVYVQEYSANPMNGLRHCASKIDSNGCVDSCFLGREWKAAGEPFGGNVTTTPVVLNGFLAKDAAAQCDLANQAVVDANAFKSSCTP
ncbi:hypothetical protein MHU86_18302 [Fragilaria crotonensis]|nr:hypothetical protein MHU86_18302 [Fragilaria crotonensis]